MNNRPKTLSIPLIETNPRKDSLASTFASQQQDSPGLSPEISSPDVSSPDISEYSAFLTASSDYSKFPGNRILAKERARKHKLRDRKKYLDGGKVPLWKSKEILMKYSMTSYFYFDFLEQGIFILFITFLICGLFDFMTVILYPYNYQAKDPSGNSFVFDLSTFSVHYFPSMLTIKISLAIVNLIVVKVYSLIKEKSRIRKYLHQKNISQNYFSILVQGLPKSLDLKNFYDFLSHHLEGSSENTIKKIVLLQDNTEKAELLRQRKAVYLQSLQAETPELRAKCAKDLDDIDQKISAEDFRLSAHERFNGSLIIILHDTYTAIKILKKWNKLTLPKRLLAKVLQRFGWKYLDEYEFQGTFLNIEKAGEPFDIVWRNSGKSEVNTFVRGIIASIVLWGAVSVYPLININYIDTEKPVNDKDRDLLGNVWAYTPFIIMIILINLAIILLINFLSIFSGLRRKSDVEKRKIAMKVAFSFISYGFLISLKAFLDNTNTSGSDKSTIKENTKESLVNTVSLLMFYLIFLPQILELLDVEFIWKWLRRKYYIKKNDFSSISQGELDEIMKQPYFDFSTRVANIAQAVFLGLVSAPFFPLAPLLASAALFAALWVDRYLILRRCSDWKLVGTNLGISFSKAFNYNAFVQIFGILLFLMLVEPRINLDREQYILVFVVGMACMVTFARYLSPLIVKKWYGDLKVNNMKYDDEVPRIKISYEDSYQNYLMDGR